MSSGPQNTTWLSAIETSSALRPFVWGTLQTQRRTIARLAADSALKTTAMEQATHLSVLGSAASESSVS